MHRYVIYGHTIASDMCLFEDSLHDAGAGETPFLTLTRRPTDVLAEELPERDRLVGLAERQVILRCSHPLDFGRISGRNWCFEVTGVVQFFWSDFDESVTYRLLGEGSQGPLVYWFVHTFLPMLLSHLTQDCILHACGIAIGSGSILLLGASRSGKSTLGSVAVTSGFRLLGDDKAIVKVADGGFLAVPAHAYSRPGREVESLGFCTQGFVTTPAKLSACVLLSRCDALEGPVLQELNGAAKFEALAANKIMGYSTDRVTDLEFLSTIARTLGIYELRRPWGREHLQASLDVIKQVL